jgi:purine-binding chemotaxis protein CheW
MVDVLHETDVVDVIRCEIGDEAYGLEMSWVRGIDRSDRMRRLPAPDGAVGLLPSDEGDFPVFSLAGRLGRDLKSHRKIPHVVVLNGDPLPVGLLVDHISPVIRVPAELLLPLPGLVADCSARYFRGIIRRDKELMLWLAPERLVPGSRPQHGGYGLPLQEPPSAGDLGGQREGAGQIVIFSTAEPISRKRPLAFGLSITQVLEILDTPPIIPLPGAPESILGLVAWHRRAIPVVDLARRLGLAPFPPDARTRLMIVRASSLAETIGILVRPSVRVRRLPLPHIPCSQPPPIDLDMIQGVVELKNETLIIPNIGSVISI